MCTKERCIEMQKVLDEKRAKKEIENPESAVLSKKINQQIKDNLETARKNFWENQPSKTTKDAKDAYEQTKKILGDKQFDCGLGDIT